MIISIKNYKTQKYSKIKIKKMFLKLRADRNNNKKISKNLF